MRIALLQHNPKAGDGDVNAALLANLALAAHRQTMMEGDDETLCLAPVSGISGISGQQGLARVGGFTERCAKAAEALAAMINTPGLSVLMDIPNPDTGAGEGQGTIVCLVRAGKVHRVVPNSGVIMLPGLRLFVADLPENNAEMTSKLPRPKADAVLFWPREAWIPACQAPREAVCSALASRWKLPVMMVQAYGATDGDVLAGQSTVFAADGELLARAPAFADAVLCWDADACRATLVGYNSPLCPDLSRWESLFHATVCGIRDYVRKCGLRGVLLGLSGGMDSALVACLAAEAMGVESERVLGVLMPSPWSSDHSITDAEALAKNLGIRTVTAPIESMMRAYEGVLTPLFAELPVRQGDLTSENLQPRIRGALLMAFANRMDYLVLATGNKSEAAVGYSTLYGDTVGGIAPIGDIYKTDVYALAEWYNAYKGREIIPAHVFTKAPSAELRPDQCDQDSLPPYDVLDSMLYALLEEGRDPASLAQEGKFAPDVLKDVLRRMAVAEFKRHQVPPVVRLTSCALGADWRMPAACRMF